MNIMLPVQQAPVASGSGNLFPNTSVHEMFQHMRATSPPQCYGLSHKLPPGLKFPLPSSNQADDVMIVRGCYERIVEIAQRAYDNRGPGSGVIFTGAQGNGKSWCSLYAAWHFIAQGVPVVYESAELGLAYVVSAVGEVTVIQDTVNKATAPALDHDHTVHIYDAVARGNRQAAESNAVCFVFSAKNPLNYKQTMAQYCIPSYDPEELLDFCELFSVSPDEVRRRCMQIGPSIRYVLVEDFSSSWAHTRIAAKALNPGQQDLLRYMDDCRFVSGTPVGKLSAGLMKVRVEEHLYEDDPLEAYEDHKVVWEFASQELCKLVLMNHRRCL